MSSFQPHTAIAGEHDFLSFKDEQMEPLGGEIICSKSHIYKRRSLDLNSGLAAPGPMFFPLSTASPHSDLVDLKVYAFDYVSPYPLI